MECIADVGAVLGEGPVWIARNEALHWLDIVSGRLFQNAAGQTDVVEPTQTLCSIVPRAAGGFIGGSLDGIVAIGADFAIAPLVHPETDQPGNRFNDGKVDREGRFWAGTMDRTERAASGSLYRLDADRRCTRIDSGYTVTNGPAFSVDGRTMYHTDSGRQIIYAFELDRAGNASNRRVFAQFGEGDGYPDGMTVDAEDCLWVAFWDGWCIRRLSPTGERLQEIAVPVQRPTSCAFGGERLDKLFITSARRDFTPAELERQPQAGGLFCFEPGVTGIAELPFAG
ncbi:SMP-30/gluconolactonase/LRE family protein [Tsuneonella sp. HG249]